MSRPKTGAYTAVWNRKGRATLGAKDEQVLEYLCENNTAPLHMVGSCGSPNGSKLRHSLPGTSSR